MGRNILCCGRFDKKVVNLAKNKKFFVDPAAAGTGRPRPYPPTLTQIAVG